MIKCKDIVTGAYYYSDDFQQIYYVNLINSKSGGTIFQWVDNVIYAICYDKTGKKIHNVSYSFDEDTQKDLVANTIGIPFDRIATAEEIERVTGGGVSITEPKPEETKKNNSYMLTLPRGVSIALDKIRQDAKKIQEEEKNEFMKERRSKELEEELEKFRKTFYDKYSDYSPED